MKKLLSRNLFAMLAAVTLVTAALVTSCNNPIEEKVQGEQEDGYIPYDPPADMGYIRVKLSNNARATFTPTPPTLTDLYYYVEVKNGSTLVESVGTDTTPVKLSTVTGHPILVAPGTYTVNVYASTTASDTTVIGFGTKSSVIVSAGTGGTVSINLQPTYDDGNGDFEWDITLPGNFPASGTTAVFTLFKYGTNDKVQLVTSLNDLDLLNVSPSYLTGTKSIPAGYYRIQIAMISSGSPALFQNRTVTHMLHIAENMTTTFDTASDAPLVALNRYAYNVTYDNNDKTPANTSTTTSAGPYAHGTSFAKPSLDPSNSEDPSYVFRGWYKSRAGANAATSTDEWNFSSGKIINDLTLYAGWSAKETLSLTVTFIDEYTSPTISVTAGSDTFSQASYVNATLESVTATLVLDTGFTVIGWSCQEISTWTNSAGSTSSSVTLINSDTGLTQYLAVGTYTFTVDLLYNKGSIVNKPYSVDFVLTVDP